MFLLKRATIVTRIILEKLKNQAKMDKKRELWCLLLRNFWVLVPKNNFLEGTLDTRLLLT